VNVTSREGLHLLELESPLDDLILSSREGLPGLPLARTNTLPDSLPLIVVFDVPLAPLPKERHVDAFFSRVVLASPHSFHGMGNLIWMSSRIGVL